MLKLNVLGYSLTLLFSLNGIAVAGDFHYAIDVTNQLVEDGNGHLTGLRMNWLYDKEATQMLIEGEDLAADKQAATLKMVADLMIADLHSQHYFTQLSLNDQALEVAKASDYQLSLLPDQRLKLDFLLPLATAQTLTGKHLAIALADPSGSAIPVYQDQGHIILGTQTQKNCPLTLEQKQEFAHGEPAQIVHLQCK